METYTRQFGGNEIIIMGVIILILALFFAWIGFLAIKNGIRINQCGDTVSTGCVWTRE
jgi:hypothetical protein